MMHTMQHKVRHKIRQKSALLPNTGIIAQKASALHIRARSLSDSMKAGSSRSFYKGRGIDFSGVREYMRGDDVRSIDWNVTARMGKPFVKLFEEERELIVFFIVDFSSSMDSGEEYRARLKTAAEAAACLLFASLHNASPVGCVLFDGEILFSAEPKSGKDYAMLLFSKLNSLPPRRVKGTALNRALRASAKLLKNRALVFVISDFRCAGYEDNLAALALKHEVAALQIGSKSDEELPLCGGLTFADTESGKTAVLPTSSYAFRREWKDFHKRLKERRHSLFIRRGVCPLNIAAGEDPLPVLIDFFSSGKRGL
ncbi:DUF58 domain-containing protein [Treponema sp. HNW]|uniref:DUF58 domain-containing protein n=1 Tax=Treponema sp. HNW TaxID=3116654 RepID=UPI003D0FEB10